MANFKFKRGETVYFMDYIRLTTGKIVYTEKVDLNNKETPVNGYIVKIDHQELPYEVEEIYTALEEDKIFKTKQALIRSIDNT